jgi:hypothetical protein
VYAQTLRVLAHHQRTPQVLQPWFDIDTLEDLWQFYQRYSAQVGPADPVASHTLTYIREQAKVLFKSYGA